VSFETGALYSMTCLKTQNVGSKKIQNVESKKM